MKVRLSMIMVILGLLLPLGVAAQRTVLMGLILDDVTSKPLVEVHIRVQGTSLVAVSDTPGTFELAVERPNALVLAVSRVGYASQEVPVSAYALATGEAIIIRMVPSAVQLPEVTIQRAAPEVVYQRNDLHVGDYLTNDEGVWILTYERPKLVHRENEQGKQVFRAGRLHLLDTNFVELASVRLPTDVCRLRHDAAHRVIVEGTVCAWVAAPGEEAIVLEQISLKTLHEQVLPWTDSIPGNLLGSNFDATFPAFDHFAFDVRQQTSRRICSVQDDFVMELFRSQYKYMSGHDKVVAMDLARETGVDAEIIAGYMTGFHNDIYFKPPYAPLFVVNDTLCVFDHHKERIRRYLPDLTAVDEVPITYHKERAWKRRLVQDVRDGSVYALFARNLRTWLRRIDPNTGQLGPERALDHPFPEEVQVHDGHAYFIYRVSGTLQHRTLYRQRIR
ncbi:MAG: carboxypeptidase-like regulatory domain-containing protein [Flavobacteriales bacterium]